MTELDLRPEGINLLFRRGNPIVLELTVEETGTWADLALPLTSTLGGADLDVDLVGDVLTVTVTEAVSDDVVRTAEWLLTDADGIDVLQGDWTPSVNASPSITNTATVRIAGPVHTAVTILAGPTSEGGGGGGAPSGPAGGVLGGTYPNPGFAVDMATQAELNTEATTRAAADTALDGRLDTIEAISIATDAELATAIAAEATSRDAAIETHRADTTNVHGIADTAALLDTGDIGVTVQAFDGDLSAVAAAGNSAVLAAITAAFTTAMQTKLGHISITQGVDLDAIETRVNDLDAAVVLRGTWDATAGTFPGGGTAQAGSSYIVSVAGTVDGVAFAVNDRVIAIADNASTTTFAANWHKADYTDQVLSVAGLIGAITDSALRTALALVPGVDIQAFHANLTQLAGLSLVADRLPYANGTGTLALATFTPFARTILDDADAAAVRTTLGLDGAYVAKALYDANTIVKADSDDTPAALSVGEQTLVGRITGGSITALTPSQVRTLLGLVIGTDVQAFSADLSDLVTRWVAASASGPASLAFPEDTDNGSNTGTITAPASLGGDRTYTLPDVSGTIALAEVAIPADKTADYTLVLADAQSSIGVDSATGKNVTVPPNADVAFPVGTLVEVRQVGAGQVTIVAGAGVTLRSAGSALKARAQYSAISLLKVATNTWSVQGDLTA